MKHFKVTILGVLLTIFLVSCNKEENNKEEKVSRATPQEFASLKEDALKNRKQEFELKEEEDVKTFTSDSGVQVTINRANIKQDGVSVTGKITIDYVEIFEKGDMLVTNKPTMGRLPDGKKALLLSGGEFYIQAYHNGQKADENTVVNLVIPTDLTQSSPSGMILWDGIIDEKGDLTWEKIQGEEVRVIKGDVGPLYNTFFSSFGWTNVDKFYSDTRPKTTLLASVPEGYNYENCSIYLSYDGEESALAHLDTYDDSTKMFSEHYGQIPIGLQCHAIFVSAEGDNWKYAIKAVTITDNGIINFTEQEMQIATETQLTVAINALP